MNSNEIIASAPGLSLRLDPSFPVEVALEVARAGEPPASAILKGGRRGRIYRHHRGQGWALPQNLQLCVKEQYHGSWLRRLASALAGSGNRTAWRAARILRDQAFPTPRALALVECGGWLPSRSLLITEFMADALRMDRYYESIPGRLGRRQTCAFVESLAAWTARFHRLGIFHRDLSPQNVLVRETAGGWEFFLIDLESVRLGRTLTFERKLKNLIQLSALYPDPFDFFLRLRFMRAYSGGTGEFFSRDCLVELRRRVIEKRAYCRRKFIEEHGFDVRPPETE